MNDIFDQAMAFFNEEGWPVHVLEENQLIQTQFRGDNGQWVCYAQANQEKNQLVFYSICSNNTPEDKRLNMAEFLTRANFGIIIGNFELNFDDGQVRYKTSLDVEDTDINPALLKNLVYANVTLMNYYFAGIMKVIYSDLTPLQIIEKIEA